VLFKFTVNIKARTGFKPNASFFYTKQLYVLYQTFFSAYKPGKLKTESHLRKNWFMRTFFVTGRLVDVHRKKIYPVEVLVEGERIIEIRNLNTGSPADEGPFILPGFVDAHIHIESSMLIPAEFARLAVVHGTVATVSDPHEIANVCGAEGVLFMIENGNTVPFKFNFGAPSCVPATTFETAGAALDSNAVEALLQREDILYLSEMMNFPGVLQGEAEVVKKIEAARRRNKPIDGHAPGLRGDAARQYIDAGISTDHECFTAEEALDKLKHGMKIIIREGSAAKNFDALIHLLNEYPELIMFCSDDKHPDSLVEGHINQLCARAVAKGIDLYKVLQAACVNPVNHYKLKVGLLRQNDFADFVLVKDLENFDVLQTYVNGQLVAENGKSMIAPTALPGSKAVNQFNCNPVQPGDLLLDNDGVETVPVIEALDGQLITNRLAVPTSLLLTNNGTKQLSANPDQDILKIVVVNRYSPAPVAISFIKNFGLKKGRHCFIGGTRLAQYCCCRGK
jgi:adenine deaminase